jgi:hypothetical protein
MRMARRALTALAALASGVAAVSADTPSQPEAPTVVSTPSGRKTIRYDAEYPTIAYADTASNNAIARLQQRLNRGEVTLKFQPPRGYLDSVLDALGIDPSSQTLVYSKTSLQFDLIDSSTPRAIYFDDDTYIAWIPGTKFLEIATMDGALGPVFYTLSNTSPTEIRVEREISRCLTCHDTWGMTGGGVPKFLFLSTAVDREGETLNGQPGVDTTDQTPIANRWAGWYVTGQLGKQKHLGNLLVDSDTDPARLDAFRPGDVEGLQGLFDTRTYMTDKSDVVALLVFEHQAYVGNLITRANFKSRTLLTKNGLNASVASSWEELPAPLQKQIRSLGDPLVRALLFVDAAAITTEIRSGSGFDKWFQSKGPRDASGRSLRDLDLRTRLFKYPLSYLIYSEGFNGLPPTMKNYVYTRLADILGGRDTSPSFAHISSGERRVLRQILASTKPDFPSEKETASISTVTSTNGRMP